MENEINLSPKQINSFIDGLSEKEKQHLSTLTDNITPEDKQQLMGIIKDPKRLSALLSSPAAEKLIAMIKRKKE